MALATLGGGAAVLCPLARGAFRTPPERVVAAFVVGMGLLGSLAFIAGLTGILTTQALVGLCLTLSAGNLAWQKEDFARAQNDSLLSRWIFLLLAIIAAVLVFDLIEALAPPTDADSLAYHFALPRDYLAQGRITFVPRAVDGAVPLLQQMTYAVALALGGERAMTLWTMLSGWTAPAALFVFARRHMRLEWSLAATLLFATTPAVIYSGGAGHNETRNAAFVIAAVLAAIEARRTDSIPASTLSGLLAGFFAASKYTGLLILPLVGLILIARRRWLPHGLAYACAALLIASPFYGWIWWNTGDPFFPVLYGLIDYRPGIPWSSDYHLALRNMFETVEKSVPSTLSWALAYPFLATFNYKWVFESGRTGFGPFVLMILPIALAGIWARRKTIGQSSLWVAVFIFSGFYFSWFLFGSSQRVRHFLPVYPLLLVCIMAAAAHAANQWPAINRLAATAIVLVLSFQLAIHAFFTINSARYIFTDESHKDFLLRNVSAYEVVPWVNENLDRTDRLLHHERQLIYYLELPNLLAHPTQDARIDVRHEATDVGRFWGELAIEDITHALVELDASSIGGYPYLAGRLIALGCVHEAGKIEVSSFTSRTIAHATQSRRSLTVLALDRKACLLEPTKP